MIRLSSVSSGSSELVATDTRPGRVEWIDCARAVCVVLVVVHHVVRQFVVEADGEWHAATSFWSELDTVLTPIRIPLFFLMSGLLAGRSLAGNGLEIRKRYVVPIYLYLVWSVLLAAREFVGPASGDDGQNPVTRFLAELILVCSGYWYLCALPLYFLVARCTRKLRLTYVLVPLVVLYLLRTVETETFADLSAHFTDSPSLIGSILANVVFFVVGARCRTEILAQATRRFGLAAKLAFLLAYALGVWAMYQTGFTLVSLVVSLVGIVIGIVFAVEASKLRRLRIVLTPVGSRTLPIYVLQFFFVSLLSFGWSKVGHRFLGLPDVFGWLYPVVTVAVVVSVSLIFYALSQRIGLKLLFEPPERLMKGRSIKRQGPSI